MCLCRRPAIRDDSVVSPRKKENRTIEKYKKNKKQWDVNIDQMLHQKVPVKNTFLARIWQKKLKTFFLLKLERRENLWLGEEKTWQRLRWLAICTLNYFVAGIMFRYLICFLFCSLTTLVNFVMMPPISLPIAYKPISCSSHTF